MDILLPKLGEGAESGTVVTILVKVGDEIKAGQTVIELENEKAVAPIPATAGGRVTQILVKEGQTVSVGQRLLAVGAAGEAGSPPSPAATADPKSAQPAPAPLPPEEPLPSPTIPTVAAGDEFFAPPGSPAAASPTIRKMARELGIDLTRVRGRERGGRIVLEDLRAYIQRLQQLAFAPRAAEPAPAPVQPAAPPTPPAEVIDFSQWGAITRKPMTSLRRTISRRMLESWTTIPQVNQFDEADITTITELRVQYSAAYEAKGVRLTLTPFILKATAAALKQSPIFNASLDEATQEIIFKDYCHLGLAVDTEAGLIVPVIHDVDKKSLLQLAADIQELAEKTRGRKIASEQLKGGTFTISNQGGIGGGHFTPIINKPEVAILGLGRSALKPVVRGKKIEPRMLMPMCVTYDHRLIDGGNAARFMVQLVEAIQNFKEAEVKL